MKRGPAALALEGLAPSRTPIVISHRSQGYCTCKRIPADACRRVVRPRGVTRPLAGILDTRAQTLVRTRYFFWGGSRICSLCFDWREADASLPLSGARGPWPMRCRTWPASLVLLPFSSPSPSGPSRSSRSSSHSQSLPGVPVVASRCATQRPVEKVKQLKAEAGRMQGQSGLSTCVELIESSRRTITERPVSSPEKGGWKLQKLVSAAGATIWISYPQELAAP